MEQPILEVNKLNVTFSTTDGIVNAVNGVDFKLNKKEVLAIVGESGSGKTQLVLSIMGLLAQNGISTGEVNFHKQNLLMLSKKKLNQIRGNKISMIFQDPMTSLNPYLKISKQMTEVLVLHKGMSEKDAKNEAIKYLELVKIPDAKRRIDMYPHEFSGGMRQRVMIAMGLLCKPDVIIADEPTTALDVTVQAQIVTLLNEIKHELNTAIILITHDLGVVAGISDKVMVMYAGKIVEYADVNTIFYHPLHPYTQGLLKSLPKLTDDNYEELPTIKGTPPSLINLPKGCSFAQRCPYTKDICTRKAPELKKINNNSVSNLNISKINSFQSQACYLNDGAF
jgi:oligopeptide transport system ATP-binding protein